MSRPAGFSHTPETRLKLSQAQTKHGYKGSSTYSTWAGMKQRCLNPQFSTYRYYGGRGITVCERWLAFANFLADMGEKPEGQTLDRIDGDGDYELANCRWATTWEQARNRKFPDHCPQGHDYTVENTSIHTRANGYVQKTCRICERTRSKMRKQKTKLFAEMFS